MDGCLGFLPAVGKRCLFVGGVGNEREVVLVVLGEVLAPVFSSGAMEKVRGVWAVATFVGRGIVG